MSSCMGASKQATWLSQPLMHMHMHMHRCAQVRPRLRVKHAGASPPPPSSSSPTTALHACMRLEPQGAGHWEPQGAGQLTC